MHTKLHIDEGRNGQGNQALVLDAMALEDSGPLAPQHAAAPAPLAGSRVGVDIGLDALYADGPALAPPPGEADIWDVPACLGAALAPVPGDGSLLVIARYPDRYTRMWELADERKRAVMRRFGLDGLSWREVFARTHGERSVEMTDYFYNGFNAEGRSLVRLFCPQVAAHYRW